MARLPRLLLAALALLTTPAAFALNHDPFVSSSAGTGTFALVANGRAASLVTDEQDFKGVQHAVADLRASWPVSDRIELYGRIENVTDANYVEVAGFGTQGRAAFIGARARF